MTASLFVGVSLILVIAIAIAFLVQLLRQPLIIAYIITGLIAGPLGLNLLNSGLEFYDVFAEFGVILLLFLVGLSLNLHLLKKIGKVALVTGVGQVIFTVLIGFALMSMLGYPKGIAICLAISITFSSTIIIMKLLSDKSELRTVYGRYTMGLMLVQDIVAIAIMIILPSFGTELSVFVSFILLILKIGIFLGVITLLSKVVLPVVIKRAASSGGEFLLIFTLAWCFALAGIGEWAGLGLEVGAIMAGLSLGSSVYHNEISSRIKPLRDFFIALFFVILGSEMDASSMRSAFLPGMMLSVFVLIGNPLILFVLYRAMKFTRRNSFLAGLTAAQVSEFGFVFLFVALQQGFVDSEAMSIFTIVALTTIFISSYLITYNHSIFKRVKPLFDKLGKDKHANDEPVHKTYEVLVFGYHRLGWKICDALKEMQVSFAVVDFDTMALKKLSERNIPHYFGDLTEIEFLKELPLQDAKMIISTLPKADDQIMLIEYVRNINDSALILANLSHKKFLEEMYNAGADYILMPHLQAGMWMAEILRKNAWCRDTFKELTEMQKKELRMKFTLFNNNKDSGKEKSPC